MNGNKRQMLCVYSIIYNATNIFFAAISDYARPYDGYIHFRNRLNP